jgi:hypothetical protein
MKAKEMEVEAEKNGEGPQPLAKASGRNNSIREFQAWKRSSVASRVVRPSRKTWCCRLRPQYL